MLKHTQSRAKRLIHLDLLRLLAIYLVIFNHTGDRGYTLFVDKIDSPIALLYMMCSVFCKIAVPLFFMISGALLLKKEETLKQLFLKRVLRIAIVLFAVSVPYYYWLHRANGIGVFDFLKWIYSDSASTSLWYLYSYLALLLMLPFLRSMVKNMQQKDFLYMLVGYLIFVGVIPCMEYLVFHEIGILHESFSPVLFMTQNVFFALMGYYFEHVYNYSLRLRKDVAWGVICSCVAILGTCLITYYQARNDGIGNFNQTEQFFNAFICIPAITVYTIIKAVGTKIVNPKVCNCISVLGSAVFGVYLIEKFLRAALDNVFRLVVQPLGSLGASLIWCFAVLCAGLTVIITLKHLPFIKKIVNQFI